MMKMNFLTIDKVNKIIELAKLVYDSKTPQSISDRTYALTRNIIHGV